MRAEPAERARRRARILACRAAARSQAEAGERATPEHEYAIVAALAALHAFDTAHPHLVDLSENPLQVE